MAAPKSLKGQKFLRATEAARELCTDRAMAHPPMCTGEIAMTKIGHVVSSKARALGSNYLYGQR
jgi:hypothetical protein